MSVVAPKVFLDTDAGAPLLTGVAGSLVELLASCLIVRKAFSATSGASFADRTTEARLQGGTPFAPFQTPGTNDEFYIGMQRPFERIVFTLATLGVGGTYQFQYWNGGAWTTFTPTDGTAGFTTSGVVSWAIGDLSTWAATTVNTFALYWIRVRLTVANSTNPTINSLTTLGWSIAYTGTNAIALQMGGGNNFFLNVNDNGPGAHGGREARVVGYETMSAIGTGTNPFPTVAQFANGMFCRKSGSADATSRAWVVVADDRTFYLATIPGDFAQMYTMIGFGDFYSVVASDPFRTMIMARSAEAVALADFGATASNDAATRHDTWGGASIGASPGKFVARNYAGAIGAVGVGSSVPSSLIYSVNTANSNGYAGHMTPFPNLADGGVYLAPVWLYEVLAGPSANMRGRLRGFWSFLHFITLPTTFVDRTTYAGAGVMAGKSFMVCVVTTRPNTGLYGALSFELSDTWETNV